MPNYWFWRFFWELLEAMGPILLASLAILIVAISYDVDRRARAHDRG